jgi:hypothetical protein
VIEIQNADFVLLFTEKFEEIFVYTYQQFMLLGANEVSVILTI